MYILLYFIGIKAIGDFKYSKYNNNDKNPLYMQTYTTTIYIFR